MGQRSKPGRSSLEGSPTLLERTVFLRLMFAVLMALSSLAASVVPEAKLDPLPIRLPIIEGKGIRFARISTAEGLSQTRVAQITQDDHGFIWFGTQYGLNRYDGYKFKVFVHDPQKP